MATTQQQPGVFDAQAAERFAALWAGWDTGNASEAEAMGKGRALRRIVAERNLRIVDALELPEIRKALDNQMQPVRLPVPDVVALEAEIEDLRSKLASVVPEVTRLAEALAREMDLTAQLNARLPGSQRNRSIARPAIYGVLALVLAVEFVLGVIGLIDGAAHHPDGFDVTIQRYLVQKKLEAIKRAEPTQPATRQVAQPPVRRKTKTEVPESSF
jgi:hypothetical protein